MLLNPKPYIFEAVSSRFSWRLLIFPGGTANPESILFSREGFRVWGGTLKVPRGPNARELRNGP